MAAMVALEQPTAADVQRLALSVEAQRQDNLRLEQMLIEMDWLRRHPPAPGTYLKAAAVQARSDPSTKHCPSTIVEMPSRARLKAPGQAVAGQPRRARGSYSHSADAAFHRWRRRLVSQGMMAPLASWRSYWAQWGIHILSRAFCGLRGQCRLRGLGRDARCFRVLRLWERHIVTCRLWRAWRAVGDALRHRRTTLYSLAFQCWFTKSKERRRIRDLLLKIVARWRHRTVNAVMLSWRSITAAAKERRARVEEIVRWAVMRLQSLLAARSLESWIDWVSERRVKRHRQRVAWRAWQLQRRNAAIYYKLQELIRRVRRQSAHSVLNYWRQYISDSVAARRLQALSRAFVARQSLTKTRAAALRLQRYWRDWLLRRQNEIITSVLAHLRLRGMSRAWHGWRHTMHQMQRLRKVLSQALARWQQNTLTRALGTWVSAHKYKTSLRDKERQLTELLRKMMLSQVWRQWVLTVANCNLLRAEWHHWRQAVQRARLSRSHREMAAALTIQSLLRRSTRSRKAAEERTAAIILQSLIRALLGQRCMRSMVRSESASNSRSVGGSSLATTPDDDGHNDANQFPQLKDARKLEAQSRAAQTVAELYETQEPSSPGPANSSTQLSDPGIDDGALISLKKKFTELRRILNKMEVGAQLHMHTPDGRVHATVWVEIDLQQLRWERRGQQSHEHVHTHAEHGQTFDHIIRVCWGAGMSPLLQGLRVHNPELYFSCECDDGSWLDFEASDASQLRDWVLGLQALVSKPGVPLVDASKLDWLLQQTRAVPSQDTVPQNVHSANSAPGGHRETRSFSHFDINQYLSECFDSVLARNGTGYGSVPALVDELVVMLNTPDTARQGVGHADMRALERIRHALVHEYLAKGRMWISFTQLVQMLTSESDTDWAQLYSTPRANSFATKYENTAWDGSDAAVLANVGLRMGSIIEIKMPVFERKAVTESKWMWRRCRIVRKAAGRYYDIEDEKLRVLMAKVARGGSLSAGQGHLDGYLDKYQPQPGWRATPPSTSSMAGGGQPVFELYFEGRQPSRFEGFVRYGGLPDKQELSAVYREGAFIPKQTRTGEVGGQVWLRAAPRHQWLDPVEVMARLDGRVGKTLSWMEKPCWISVEGHMLFLREGKGVDYALALDLDRCTLAIAANGALAVLGPSLQRKFPATDGHAVLLLTPHNSALHSDTANEPKTPAEVSVELKDLICARQRATFEWRPVADPSSVPTAFHQ